MGVKRAYEILTKISQPVDNLHGVTSHQLAFSYEHFHRAGGSSLKKKKKKKSQAVDS